MPNLIIFDKATQAIEANFYIPLAAFPSAFIIAISDTSQFKPKSAPIQAAQAK